MTALLTALLELLRDVLAYWRDPHRRRMKRVEKLNGQVQKLREAMARGDRGRLDALAADLHDRVQSALRRYRR